MVLEQTALRAPPGAGGKEDQMLMPGQEAPDLTGRERKVLNFVCERFRDKEIADLLGVSPRTVQTHVALLRDKYGVHSRDELRQVAKDQ
jgi:DNA-binding CsgD family transcriptional regulator